MSTTFEETRNFIKEQQYIITKLRTQLNSFYGTHPQLPADTIIDEQQPVIWNRDEVKRQNKAIEDFVTSTMATINECHKNIAQKMKDYIQSEYQVSAAIADIIFNAAYAEGHSAGYYEVLAYINDFADFAISILNADK